MAPSLRSPRLVVGVFLLIAVLAAACGSSGAAPVAPAGGGAGEQPAGGPGGQSGGSGGAGGSEGSGAGSGSSQQGGGADGSGQGGNGGQGNALTDLLAVLPDGTRIVYNGSLSLQVDDVDAAITQGRVVVGRVGGYLAGSRQTRDPKEQVASITYRIPADRWEEALEALRRLGTVLGEATDAEEVTSQIVDLEARIRNLRASESAVERLTREATGIDELLEVEARLAQLRGQIEQLDAQRAALTDRAAFGTLTVTFSQIGTVIAEPSPTPAVAPAWDAGRDVAAASGTLVAMLQVLASVGIWFAIVWLPVLVAAVVLGLVLRSALRRLGVMGLTGGRDLPGAGQIGR